MSRKRKYGKVFCITSYFILSQYMHAGNSHKNTCRQVLICNMVHSIIAMFLKVMLIN